MKLSKTLKLTAAGAATSALALVGVGVGTAEAASLYNQQLPNGCQIDAQNWFQNPNANGSTSEDFSCEKINVKTRYYDTNVEAFRTADSGYQANGYVIASGPSNQSPAWSDHNGLRNGSYQGFRL